jgi:S-(hydroxymethyl)glutathione dehydrogenase/alcohol dehydrogenase
VKGFGGVGMAAAYCLKSLDYENVYVDDTSEERLQVAVNSGFALSRYLGTSCKYDLVFDTTGSAKALEESFHILTEKGKLVFASHPPKNSKITIDPFDLIKGKTIEGTWGGEIRSQFDLDSLYGIVGDKISRRDFIGAEFPFESINDALHYALKAHSGRALIFFGKEKVSQ